MLAGADSTLWPLQLGMGGQDLDTTADDQRDEQQVQPVVNPQPQRVVKRRHGFSQLSSVWPVPSLRIGHVDVQQSLSDHRRILATMSFADDKRTKDRLVSAMNKWRRAARDFKHPPPIQLPSPAELQLDTVQLPRDAFFAPTEMVPAAQAAGRIAAGQITPYPPGISAVVPGERLNDAVIDYLRSGAQAGMNLPDSADPTAQHFRVVA